MLGLGALNRQEKRQARLLAVIGPHRPAAAIAAPRQDRLRVLAESPWLPRIAALFGLRLDREAEYPIRWWVLALIETIGAKSRNGVWFRIHSTY